MSNLKCVGASTLVSTLTALQIQVTIWDKHDRYKLIFQMPKNIIYIFFMYLLLYFNNKYQSNYLFYNEFYSSANLSWYLVYFL